MSGIEIVGIALGVLPLFISAAEHYRDGLGFVRRAIKKHTFIAQYRDELIAQRALLGLYIKEILERTGLPAKTQADLIEKPDGDSWRKAEVVRELSKELGDAYGPFVGVLTKICVILAKQIKSIEVTEPTLTDDELRLQDLCIEAAKPEVATKAGPKDVWARIKFSMKHYERDILLAELKEYNRTLEKLGSASNRAKAYERKQQMRKIHASFELREEIERLYQAMCKACSCQPCQQKDVGLGLAVHNYPGQPTTDISFQIYLFDHNNNICATSVKMIKASEPSEPPTKKVRIHFQKDQETYSSTQARKRLQDICKENELAQRSKARLQLLVDEKGHLYTTQSTGPQISKDEDPMLSLSEVMSDWKPYDHKRWLQREKAILAVILAHSLPQIHESSWWQSRWNSNSISFCGVCPGSAAAKYSSGDLRIKLRNPFTLSAVADQGGPSNTGPTGTPRRNAHLHALGIVLLEIYLNRPLIADMSAQGGVDSSSDCRNIALDLLEEVADDDSMSADYLRAMQFCLSPRPNPYSGSFSFQDPGFREMFYEEVILALENHLMNKYKIDDLFWSAD
ncbi:hypothetical protein LTR67_006862 [Exophiala xenobiotica]